jgi:hypothetical protein
MTVYHRVAYTIAFNVLVSNSGVAVGSQRTSIPNAVARTRLALAV